MSDYYTTQGCLKTLEQMAKACRREANMRKRVYPRWAEAGKITADQAEHEIQCMESAALVLQRLVELRDASEEMRLLEQKKQERKQPELKI
jgi:hypothetical protein